MLPDIVLALRRLRHAPGFTFAAVATLAFAIGANTAIFSVADTVLFKRLPYGEPDRVYVLTTVDVKTGERSRGVPIAYVQSIHEHHGGLAGVGLRGPTMMTTHVGNGEAQWMETFAVTPDYLRVLGVQAVRGRLFEPRDTAEPGRAAVLTYESWQRRFGGNENIVGRAVTLGPDTRDVIGILPRGFVFPTTSLRFLYSPTGRPEYLTVMAQPSQETLETAPYRGFEEPIVRLETGVTREQAQARVDALVAALRTERDERVTLENPRDVLFPTGRPVLALLVVAAGFVLLVGSVNLAQMLLARTRRREREIGLHIALGATPLRVVRPIVCEALIVGMAAGLAALCVTAVTFDLLVRQVPPSVYGSADLRLDGRVALFAMALGVIAGLAFAVLPAWWSATLDVQTLVLGRRDGTWRRRGQVLGQPAIAVQVGLAIVLVFGAVIATRTFVSVLGVPLGFVPDRLIAINARPDGNTPGSLRGFYERAVDALARRGDVLAAGAGGSVPADGFGGADAAEASASRPVDILYVLPGYLETIDAPLLRGRRLTTEDLHGGGDFAVLSESAARALFAGRDAIGATFRSRQGRQLTVVGLVADVRRSLTREMPPPAYAFPPADTTRGMTIVARMRDRTSGTLPDVRREIAALAPGSPVTAVWWSDSLAAQAAYRNPRFQTLVLGTFAMLALGLSALGIFAAVASAVATRTREMGVRLALGAPPPSLVRLIVRQALAPVAAGIVAGVAASHWLRRLAEAQLVDVDAHDPVTLVIAAATVAVAAFVSAYLPARHATRVDPIAVLRAE